VNDLDHTQKQRAAFDAGYAVVRSHVESTDPATRYIVDSRLAAALARLRAHAGSRLSNSSSVLFSCAGEGGEASLCRGLGYGDVTFTDISPVAVESGLARDPRLKGFAGNAEALNIADASYDIVIVQDGLHHLQSPVRGFTEMLRVARVGTIFIEPHQSLVGDLIGTKWERNGPAVNYVFRWSRSLVEDIASSYLGPDSFDNLSFSYWHHNMVFARLAKAVGEGQRGVSAVKAAKGILDTTAGRFGNMFSGIVLKRPRR